MFGEKKNEPTPAMDYFMDLNEGVGNDMDKVEQGCHGVAHKARYSGGSNFVFVDGSARYMRYGSTVWPLNLWAVNDTNRLVSPGSLSAGASQPRRRLISQIWGWNHPGQRATIRGLSPRGANRDTGPGRCLPPYQAESSGHFGRSVAFGRLARSKTRLRQNHYE